MSLNIITMTVTTAILLVAILGFVCGLPQKADDSIFLRTSTKTANRYNSNKDVTVDEELQECASKIWMYTRHGTRYPKEKDITKMHEDLPSVRTKILNSYNAGTSPLTAEQIDELNAWVPLVDFGQEQLLTKEGELENMEIARRMSARYPNLFPTEFSNDTYLFKFTDSQRTRQSSKSFAIGLFGEENIDDVYFPEPSEEDTPILEFFEVCSKWLDEIGNNEDTLFQQDSFDDTAYIDDAVANIKENLGITEKLSFGNTKTVYKACAFETAWNREKVSPWCMPLTVENVKPLEYSEDLDYFYNDGYGNEFNTKIACRALTDMINFFDDDENTRKANLYFTHSEALHKFVSLLGLYKDDELLTYENFEKQQERKWKVSQIGCFATNVAVVLHECGGTKSISVMQNEYVVRLPACPDSDTCDLETVKEYYANSIGCDFDALCEIN